MAFQGSKLRREMRQLYAWAFSCTSTLFPALARASTDPSSNDLTVFFHNNGNWSTHGTRPSALFVNVPVSYSQAVSICEAYNETLLGCEDFDDHTYELSYQQYLGVIDQNQTFWSSCSSSCPVDWQGTVSKPSSTSAFVCTNSAPFVSVVDTDSSKFPTVSVESNGTVFEGLRDHMAFRFIGIPFAKPPTGALRFRYAEDWSASYVDATRYSAGCLQYGWFDGNAYGLNPWGNSEDCLYLNVYSSSLPAANSSAPLKPVMLWYHGGGQTTGTGTDSTFDGASLVSRSDVVLVVPNYRLNIFGYLTTGDDIIPGNYALTDKLSALRWVQKHISDFGGDPNNVTIFGQSAGGGSVIDVLTSPYGEGLFNGVILQSAGRGHDTAPDVAAATNVPVLNKYCNNTGYERLQCLQELPAETLLNLTYSELTSWKTIVDQIYVPDISWAQLAKGQPYISRNIKYLSGHMPEEAQSLLETVLNPNVTSWKENLEILLNNSQITPKQAEAIVTSGQWQIEGYSSNYTSDLAKTFSDVYNASINVATDAQSVLLMSNGSMLYIGGYALSYYDYYDLCTFPVGRPETPYYRCYSSDLYEVFGTYYLFDQPIRVDEDVYYTNAVQDMWASFARTGNPNVNQEYLKTRGYNSTLEFFENWSWPEYTTYSPEIANLQYPPLAQSMLPDLAHCKVLLPYTTLI
ncbi:carboxylesterase [Aspergillus sclerotioniger CBS 115572]|uniref:Carboxylic ester hydrolase n=1 Tax=Aspergillus sclerotioniger CBS 115572 TaxID=1450535 RepID=A0A317V2G1_9EURO|nr:carboxylesterase [Aspergillus sclerotioniger CBS 115572]PWY67218.1 carboxylesterase [Aspergillus sclerotioniger CBS 115572]